MAASLLTWYLCPEFKTSHDVSGYRTSRSMKNQDTWNFSQKYCAKISLCMFSCIDYSYCDHVDIYRQVNWCDSGGCDSLVYLFK
ncbi:SdpI family protein [Corynebacterium silvaticum]|nr:SdpI family protein [Corynebacterium silvaticum]UWH03268.1 SdpI family protein [Corynebacterium silvaticum]UWH05304.1 SdpI family protein [Corynebacterium silvaticum]UXZ27468.1 SdpI family protein [Corynebacterium silvaticum]UXZ31548.1 SdpI family protein [Corynebacterium silvaticum]